LRLGVETDGLAHPVAAAGALLEERADLLRRVVERGVVRRTADRPLDLVCRRLRAPEKAAEEVVRGLESGGRHPQLGRLERRHVAVVALLAEELELKPLVRRQVLIIAGELDVRHGANASSDEVVNLAPRSAPGAAAARLPATRSRTGASARSLRRLPAEKLVDP